MKVNKEHPDYPVYIEKCRKLRDNFEKETEPLWKPTGGMDGNSKLFSAQREHNRKLKELQREFSHLFS